MGLFGDDKKKKKQQDIGALFFMNDALNDNEYDDEELDDYGLTEEEKELVRKGENDPWNFDEEDLEDDDFYGEDDD
ncbi:MAG: hypothetical protein IJH20_05490 [Bacilli bacterium]|nr:hypothetical protein [Bacilli bacterium]